MGTRLDELHNVNALDGVGGCAGRPDEDEEGDHGVEVVDEVDGEAGDYLEDGAGEVNLLSTVDVRHPR